MLYRIIIYIAGFCLFHSKVYAQCLIWSLSASGGNCLSGANLGSYEVTGTLITFPAPSSGTLTITGGNGTSVTYNAPFSASINYTLPATPGHGNSYTVTASYSASSSCNRQRSYTTPDCCTVTPADTTPDVCAAETLILHTTGTNGGYYYWTGPNGFSSTQQSPSIPHTTAAHAGVYQVYLINGSCTSPTEQVNVTVNPKPVPKTINHP